MSFLKSLAVFFAAIMILFACGFSSCAAKGGDLQDSSLLRIAHGKDAAKAAGKSEKSKQENLGKEARGVMQEQEEMDAEKRHPKLDHMKVRLTWPIVSGAVSYEVELLKSSEVSEENFLEKQREIFLNGVELSLAAYGEDRKDFYFRMRPLDFDRRPMEEWSKPRKISEGEFDTKSPLPMTEYDKMSYFPVYPVYSWIPMIGMKDYEVEVIRHRPSGDVRVRRILGGSYDVYEDGGYTYPGRYSWRVRALMPNGTPISEWSDRQEFFVADNARIAAIGDSITHGGGAVSVPPSYQMYNWESYADVPILNIGFSGNTTASMLERFDRDVQAFAPKILVIMGGVNDYRSGTPGAETVQNLAAMRDRCVSYGCIPVFVTVTSLHPNLIAKRKMVSIPPSNWKIEMQYINDWVRKQKYFIDATTMLNDADGNLRKEYTTDGLHPDAVAKKIMGEAIGGYLKKNFPQIAQP